MCFYCGCRDIPLISDLIAEHERVGDLGADLTLALRGGDVATARPAAGRPGRGARHALAG
jgi:hypothetical protein